MKLASLKGIPPMRPCFFDFPQDEQCLELNDQLMFGPDILAAPVLQFKARSRMVYLPRGCRWMNAHTHRIYPGGTWVKARAPLAHIPVFVREGREELAEIIAPRRKNT